MADPRRRARELPGRGRESRMSRGFVRAKQAPHLGRSRPFEVRASPRLCADTADASGFVFALLALQQHVAAAFELREAELHQAEQDLNLASILLPLPERGGPSGVIVPKPPGGGDLRVQSG